MNKTDLINKISEKTNLSKNVCKKVVNETINLIKECFYSGVSVNIKEFGKFGYKKINERMRFVPSLECTRYEKQKIVPRFKPSKSFYGKLL